MNIIGEVAGKSCILIDDIVDSGGTLCNAAEALMAQGAKDVTRLYHPRRAVGRRRGAGHLVKAQASGDHRLDPAHGSGEGGAQHPRDRHCVTARRSHWPDKPRRVGVEPV